jgi:hypothetical protein
MSGVIVSAAVDTEDALDALPFAVVVIVACAAVRTALFAAALVVLLALVLVVLAEPVELVLELGRASDTTLLGSETALLDTANDVLAAEAAAAERGAETGGVDVTEAVVTARGEPATTEPALSCVVSDPLACPPEVLTHICLSIDGRVQYAG